jgi:hypothetical protein
MCADNAECMEGKCICKKYYTGDGYTLCVKPKADITLEVQTSPGSISIYFGSSVPVHTSHITTVGSSPEGFYHQNIIGKNAVVMYHNYAYVHFYCIHSCSFDSYNYFCNLIYYSWNCCLDLL